MQTFTPGQRWISETEPELGLGRIVSAGSGRVEVEFPAADEKRIYAIDNAPLKRVAYHAGDQIQDTEGKTFTVDTVSDLNGCLVYHCGNETIHEAFLQDLQTFDRPERRLASGHVDSVETFALRKHVLEKRTAMMRSPVRGLLGARIDLIPHQLFIASEVSRRDVPRVLLADEVGLGKTIEACLILHRMLITGKASRALILVPDALTHQWFVELYRRFSLSCRILDDTHEPDQDDPFLEDQLFICGIRFLLSNPAMGARAVNAEWDVLIVDEAHHLEWSVDAPSPAYQLVDVLAQKTSSVLLLTATPEQLGPESHFARLRLLDPHRYASLGQYLEEHAQFERVVKKTNRLVEEGDEAALQDLLDRHGPGRVMFRNTRATMKGFPKRMFRPWQLDPDTPVAGWLAGLLRDNPKTKYLIITQTRNEVVALHKQLQKLIHVDTALFHEDMPIVQCDRQAAWFAEQDGARILIASEVGGEGRNFQFVQNLILVHVPDDPEMLEQRIGRLDRIGQSGAIQIHVPYAEGTPEADRVRWYHEGLNAFEEPLAGSHEIMQMFRDRLDQVDDALIEDTKKFRLDLKKRIEQGRDRLLELNSCRPKVAAGVVNAVAAHDASRNLEEFLLPLFDHFGVNPEHLQRRDYLLKRSHLFDSAFPLGGEEMHMTYDRKQALAREDMTLMTWDHPMVGGAIELLLGSEAGNAAIAIDDTADGVTLEAVFVLECIAPPALELPRFLPPTPVSVSVSVSADQRDAGPYQREVGTGVPAGPKGFRNPKPWELEEVKTGITQTVSPLLEEAKRQAEAQAAAIIEAARRELNQVVGQEVRRIRELQKVNSHIRDEEVTAAEARLEELTRALENPSLRLDSVLLITGVVS